MMFKQLLLRLAVFALFPIFIITVVVWISLYLVVGWFSILTHGVGWTRIGILHAKTRTRL